MNAGFRNGALGRRAGLFLAALGIFGAYLVGPHRVWGATARVMGQLGAVLGEEPGSPG